MYSTVVFKAVPLQRQIMGRLPGMGVIHGPNRVAVV